MPMQPENEIRRKERAQDISSNFYSQPWWRGFGNSDGSPVSLTERTMKSSAEQQERISTGFIQTEANDGQNNGANVNKEPPSSISLRSGIYYLN